MCPRMGAWERSRARKEETRLKRREGREHAREWTGERQGWRQEDKISQAGNMRREDGKQVWCWHRPISRMVVLNGEVSSTAPQILCSTGPAAKG